ncbi:MAG TPA: hypothetical protein VGG49_13105 [Steroidobacteraceae bacterium]
MNLQVSVARYRRPTIHDPPDPRIPPAPFIKRLNPAQIKALGRETALDPRFRGIDRFLWRWSVGQGTTLPIDAEEAEGLPLSRPTPLQPDVAIVVDQAIQRSAEWARRFVFLWFRSDRSTQEIAVLMRIRLRAVYDERKIVFSYYLGRFHEIGIRIPSWEPDL